MAATAFYDKRGIPICPGDLIKSPHFIGARGKRYYLYHTAVNVDGRLWMVPTSHLEPAKVNGGGKCPISQDLMSMAEVIQGSGPGDILDHTDRPRGPKPKIEEAK